MDDTTEIIVSGLVNYLALKINSLAQQPSPFALLTSQKNKKKSNKSIKISPRKLIRTILACGYCNNPRFASLISHMTIFEIVKSTTNLCINTVQSVV